MNKTIILLLFTLLMSACAHDSMLEEEELDPQHTVIITVPDKIMEEPDVDFGSRAAYTMNPATSKMIYSWDAGDQIGVFNVSLPAGQNNESTVFDYKYTEGTVARFYNNDFVANTVNYWVAYAPYKCNITEDGGRKKIFSYDNINLTYKGQKQIHNATPQGKMPTAANGYGQASEALACNQLADYDYIVTTPTHPAEEGETMHLTFKHIGATVRCYMLLPEGCFGGAGKTGMLTSMSIVCKEPKLVTDVKLEINQYDTYQSNGKQTYSQIGGVTTSKILTLDLPGPQGNGIEVIDHGYFISYMEFYPSNFAEKDCYILLTANVDGVTKYFRSQPLPEKNMKAGYFYKWSTNEFDEPIELTATIAPWEDISGGTINTGE